MRNFVILTALALSAACQPAPKAKTSTMGGESAAVPAGLSAQDEAAIRAVDTEWARAATAGDGAALTALYTADATLPPPNESVAKGEAVKKYNDDMVNGFSGPTELTTTVVGGQGTKNPKKKNKPKPPNKNGQTNPQTHRRPGRPLPHRARARAGRHGHRLSRAGPEARPQGRDQGAAPRSWPR